MREWFRVEAAGGKKGGGEILIFGRIGRSFWDDTAVGAKAFVEELDKLVAAGPGDVHLRINSPGGDVWDGTAIYNAIRRHKARVYSTIEGVAFSMASVIALAGREVRMWDTSQFMVHRPQTFAYGEEKDLEQAIQALKTARKTLVAAYRAKTALSVQEVEGLMSATTFMTAEEAQEKGFVDTVLGADDEGTEASARPMAACFDVGAWAAFYRGAGPLPLDGGAVAGAVDEVDKGALGEGLTTTAKDEKGCGSLAAASQAGMSEPLGGAVDVVDSGRLGRDAGVGGGDAPGNGTGAVCPKKEVVMGIKMSELKAACPGADGAFLVAQFELCEADEKRSVSDVQAAFIAAQAVALEAAREEAAQAKAAAAAKAQVAKVPAAPAAPAAGPPPTGLGVKALDVGDDAGEVEGDPAAAWEELVSALEGKGMARSKAVVKAATDRPDIHAAYLSAHNGAYGRPAGRFAV